jgi:ABC-2 type transport system ATP-binding protein
VVTIAPAPENAAQLADLGLQGVSRVGRLPVTSQHVDQPVGTDRLAAIQRQQRDQSPLLGTADASATRYAGNRPASAPRQSRLRPRSQAYIQDHIEGGRIMIEIDGLTKRYGDKTAVDGLSFVVEPGVVTGFLGPNGAGKSTTMRLIAGLDRPTSGTVRVNGKHYPDSAAPMSELGILLDARSVHPGLSARNNLLALARTAGIGRRRVDEVIEVAGLAEVAGTRAGGFSLGMGQRLGVAAALLGQPQTVVLDEPVNGLDPDGVRWIRLLLKSLAAEGRTVFISSHLMSEMAQTATRLVVLGRGQLISQTSVEDFTNHATAGNIMVRTPETARLGQLLAAPGVTVANDGTDLLRVSGTTAEQIGTAAWRAHLPVFELTPTHASLEEAFMQVTQDSIEYHAGATR